MFARELEARQKKFERDALDRIKKDRRRIERERREREVARKRAEQFEEENRLKRLAQEAAREADEARKESMRESNRGVFFEERLRAVPVPESLALEKGIKRGCDKVLLPPSVGMSLMNQDASRNGAMFFEISTGFGTRTHAGLLEFTALEGTVGLPEKVIRSLWGREGECQGHVTVAYKRLDKGEYVRFQPIKMGFHESVGDDMRVVLEQCLMRHCTLTEGDYVQVGHEGVSHELKVTELRPQGGVSLIDTDLEADIIASEEVEAAIRAEEEAARKLQEARARMLEEERQRQLEQERKEQEEEEERRKRAAELEAIQKSKAENLPHEIPSTSGEPNTLCLVRLPDGSRCQRRFKLSDSLSLLFDFVDSKGAGGCWPGTYNLVTQFPRRVFTPEDSRSFEQTGLSSSQEALLLEPVNQDA